MIKIPTVLAILCWLFMEPAIAQQSPPANWEKVLIIEAGLITDPAWDVKHLADSTIKKGLALAVSQAIVAIVDSVPQSLLKTALEAPAKVVELVRKSTTDYFQRTIKDPTNLDVIGIGIDIAAGAIAQGIEEVYANDPIKAGLATAAVKGATVIYAGLTKGLQAAIAKEVILTAETWVQIIRVWNDIRRLDRETAETERRTIELERTLAESRKQQATYNATEDRNIAGALVVLPEQDTGGSGGGPVSRSGAIAYACAGVCGDTLTASGTAMKVNSANEMVAYSFSGLVERGAIGTATVVDTGSAADMYWGRWTSPGAVVTRPSGSLLSNVAVHYIYGPPVVSMPMSGTATYMPVGGTTPTSPNGAQTGTFQGGSIAVNFTTRSVSLNNLTFGFGGQTFVMNAQTTYTNTLRFADSLGAHIPGRDVTCGNCPGATGGSYSGRFTGSTAQGIGLSYAVGNTVTGSFAGVLGFKR